MNVKNNPDHILTRYVHQIQHEGWGAKVCEHGCSAWEVLTKKPWPLNPELANGCRYNKRWTYTREALTDSALPEEKEKEYGMEKLDGTTFKIC